MSGGMIIIDTSGFADTVMTTNGDMIYYNGGRARLPKGSDGEILTLAAGFPSWASVTADDESLLVACSDESTVLTTGQKISFRMPFDLTLSAGIAGIKGSLVTAGTGAALLTIDINEGGSSILSTDLTFDSTETTTITAATPVVISDTTLAADSIITIDVDQLDTDNVATGLKIAFMGTRT